MINFFKNARRAVKSNLAILLLLFLPVLYAYYNIWNTFFVADAWHMLNSYILIGDYGFNYFFQLFAMPYGTHFVPIGMAFSSLETYILGSNARGYGIVALLLHFINVYIIYLAVRKITKSTHWGIVAGIFFGVNYAIRGGVFWYASNLWNEIGATLVLIGLAYLYKFYEDRRVYMLVFSYALFVSSIFIKEYAFMLLPLTLLFLTYMCFEDRLNIKKYLLYASIYLITTIGYLILRFFFINPESQVVTSSDFAHSGFYISVLWNLFTLIPKFLANIFIPEQAILFIANFISINIYHDLELVQSPVFQTVLFYDQLYIFIGSLLTLFLFALVFLLRKIPKKYKIFLLLYGLAFIFVPMVYLTLDKYLYWIFSRYLYLPTAIFTIFFFCFMWQFKILRKINALSISLFLILMVYYITHAHMNHNFFNSFAKTGQERQATLSQLSSQLDFSNKEQVVFVKTSGDIYKNDTDIFNNGTSFGKVLVIWSWYQGNQNIIPSCLYDPMFLFNSNNQYKFCDGKGYGYFQDIDKLKATVNEHNIDVKNVTSFNYDKETNTLTNISSHINAMLQQDE